MIKREASGADTGNGRRIYIHQNSFESLAVTDALAAQRVYTVLGVARAIKLVHHYVADQGVDLGLASAEQAEEIGEALRVVLPGTVTDFMQDLGYRPRRPDMRDQFLPVLIGKEVIEASCEEAGWYTFATSAESGRIMYDDHDKLRELWTAYMKGEAPNDLTMIKRPSLAFIGGGDKESLELDDYAVFIDQLGLGEQELISIRAEVDQSVSRVATGAFEAAAENLHTGEIDLQLKLDVIAAIKRASDVDSL